MQIINEVKLDFDDVLIRPKRSNLSSRSEVNLIRTFTGLHSGKKITGIPIIASNFDTIGTFRMAEALDEYGIFTCLHKFYRPEELIEFFQKQCSSHSFYTLGMTNSDLNKLQNVRDELKSRGVEIERICVDVANGYTEYFQEYVKKIRSMFRFSTIMAGNVATPEMAQELIISGAADIVKVGIGPGSLCETRKVTGIGYPQLSSILECVDSCHGLKGLICADGGCQTSGDIAKAFGGGADFVMIGGMLGGVDECDGEWEYDYEKLQTNDSILITGQKKKTNLKFYGMSSKEAMEKYNGMAEYRASEGKCISVPYKGPVKDTVQQILGGLRSACSYVGASCLKDFSKCTTFVRKR